MSSIERLTAAVAVFRRSGSLISFVPKASSNFFCSSSRVFFKASISGEVTGSFLPLTNRCPDLICSSRSRIVFSSLVLADARACRRAVSGSVTLKFPRRLASSTFFRSSFSAADGSRRKVSDLAGAFPSAISSSAAICFIWPLRSAKVFWRSFFAARLNFP